MYGTNVLNNFGRVLGRMASAFLVCFTINCNVSTTPDNGTTTDPGTGTTNGTSGSSTTNCTSNPAKSGLTASSSTSVSHNAGQDCMSCHTSGGSASTVWAAAGTLYASKDSTTIAAAGSTVTDVGGTTLTVDTCGNFYATSLTGDITSTRPKSTNSGKTMGQSMGSSDGSCNRSGCHTSSAQGVVY